MSTALLREMLRLELATLIETAASPSVAASRGLALMAPGHGEGVYVLYDAEGVESALAGMSGERTQTMARVLRDEHVVIGILAADKLPSCWSVRQVTSVAAEKGYGPLMYDIALSDGPLAPMRDSVSLSAERVWRRYYEDRSDVRHVPLKKCKNHVSVRPWLNFSYELTGPGHDVSALKTRHERVLDTLAEEIVSAEVKSALERAGSMYFDSRYTEA